MENISKTEKLLRKHKLRVTDMRKEVLNIFLAKNEAQSQHDIELLLSEFDRITLYRTLKSFQEKGLIHKALDSTDVVKYALCSEDCSEHDHNDEHVHFHCESCGNTFCVEEVEIPMISMPSGYSISSTNVVLNGTCRRCP